MKTPTSPLSLRSRRLSIPSIDGNSTSAFIAHILVKLQEFRDSKSVGRDGQDMLRRLKHSLVNPTSMARTSCLLISQVHNILRKGRFKKEITIIALCYLERFYRIIREADENFAHPIPLFPIFCVMLSLALKQVSDFALSSSWWVKTTGIKGFGRLEYSVWCLLESKQAIFIAPEQFAEWEKTMAILALEFGSKLQDRLSLNLFPIPNPNTCAAKATVPPSPPMEPSHFQPISTGSRDDVVSV